MPGNDVWCVTCDSSVKIGKCTLHASFVQRSYFRSSACCQCRWQQNKKAREGLGDKKKSVLASSRAAHIKSRSSSSITHQHHNPSTWVSSDSALSLLAWARPARCRAMFGTCHTDVGADVATGGALSPRVPDSAGQCRIVQDAARCDRQRWSHGFRSRQG